MFNQQFLREEAHKNCLVIQYLPDSLLYFLTKVLVLALTVSILLLLLLVAAIVRFPRCFPAALSFPLWRSPYQSPPIHDINFQTCETTLFYFPPSLWADSPLCRSGKQSSTIWWDTEQIWRDINKNRYKTIGSHFQSKDCEWNGKSYHWRTEPSQRKIFQNR